MNRVALAVVSLALTLPLSGAPARGELCTIDAVPAATLLLPYFEIDLAKLPRFTKVEQTVISVQNASPEEIIAHVTLWTDLSVPTLAFDVYLTGFDVEQINLTELFHTGGIRGLQTGPGTVGLVLGTTPTGGLANRGDLIKAHRGEAVGGKCYGRPVSRNVARGYLTIDSVSVPTTLFPSDPGYFSAGVANDRNALWGVVFVKSKKSLQADLLVHIEAATGKFAAGDYTFYGRYVDFFAIDLREPLPNQWAARYDSGSEQTELFVWRDSGVRQGPFTCSQLGQAGWYPLLQSQVLAFDDAESAVELFVDPVHGTLPGLPAEAQKIAVASSAFDVSPYRSGWIYLNLNEPRGQSQLQSYLGVRQIRGKGTAVYPGIPYLGANPCDSLIRAATLAPIP